MSFISSFKKLPRIVQIILLLIPGVNWVTEILVRWSAVIHGGNLINTVVAIIFTIFGIVLGWVDLIWCLLFKKLLFT